MCDLLCGSTPITVALITGSYGLRRLRLIGLQGVGSAEWLAARHPTVKRDELVLSPYASGIELYLWAHGLGHMSAHTYFDQAFAFPSEDFTDVRIPEGAELAPPASASGAAGATNGGMGWEEEED